MRADEEAYDADAGGCCMPQRKTGERNIWITYLSIKVVYSVDEAIAHINRYNTGHSEAIITNNYDQCPEIPG